jgi:diacylglycerol O-acyltransferase / wax synthase
LTMTRRLSALDTLFLYSEGPETMMHVAALLPFTPPPGASPTYLRDIVDRARASGTVTAPWNRKLRHPRLVPGPIQAWVSDDHVDLDYHVRRSALASPGDERELGVLVSRLHSHPLDLTRPPWEMHIIEGLEGGRFAIYIKIHHSLCDGYTGMRLLTRSMSTDPGDLDTPLFFSVPAPPSATRETQHHGASLEGLANAVAHHAISALSLGKLTLDTLMRREPRDLIALPQAPHSMLNRRIGRSRRFAIQQYPLSLLKQLGAERDATINDVLLAIIGGGLRTWLSELGELPQSSLIAFVPVNVRPAGDSGGGNAVGGMLAHLGTDVADPVQRLELVSASTRAAKLQLERMTREAIGAYSALLLAPAAMQVAAALTGIRPPAPLAFNLTVSNVPGPRKTMYLCGSRLQGNYPASIPVHGCALNVTVHSYANTANLGFIGDRDALPHLQRLAVHTGHALQELEGRLTAAPARNGASRRSDVNASLR